MIYTNFHAWNLILCWVHIGLVLTQLNHILYTLQYYCNYRVSVGKQKAMPWIWNFLAFCLLETRMTSAWHGGPWWSGLWALPLCYVDSVRRCCLPASSGSGGSSIFVGWGIGNWMRWGSGGWLFRMAGHGIIFLLFFFFFRVFFLFSLFSSFLGYCALICCIACDGRWMKS